MLRTILSQMWNRRRQNGWIFLELLFVGVFLWAVLDPLCVQLANKSIDRGYQSEGLYVLELAQYGEASPKYRKEVDTDSVFRESYLDIVREIRNLPEVESFVINHGQGYANSGSFWGGYLYADSAKTKRCAVLNYFVYPDEGSDLLKTYRFRDVNTGGVMEIAPDFHSRNIIYISENAAKLLFGRTDVVGEKTYLWNNNENEIGGVFKDYKYREYNQPCPMMIGKYAPRLPKSGSSVWEYSVVFRIKDNVNSEEFEQRFSKEIRPLLHRGNIYCAGIDSMENKARSFAEQYGELNIVRKNTLFAIFGLVCVFLGMVGTFWVRTNARRQEIGVMRSLGASKQRIMSQFLLEAGVLVTVTVAIVVVMLGYYVYTEGFFAVAEEVMDEANLDLQYWQNCPLKHFGVISGATYLSLLVTSFIGTFIPVNRVIRELPADALRNE